MVRTLSEALRVRTSFTRSVSVERDIDQWGNERVPYVMTPLAARVMDQVFDDLVSSTGVRAWSITGPYGTGKSAFAMAVTRLLSPGSEESSLYRDIAKDYPDLLERLAAVRSLGSCFVPVLIGGHRGPITPALHSGLQRTVERVQEQTLPGALAELQTAIARCDPNDAREVCALYERAAADLSGIVVVLDELGQYLQYAAQRPDQADVAVLQLMAEAASRSGERPLLLFTILHQAFSRYNLGLSQAQRDEFSKIQGRFHDVAFSQTHDQMVRLAGQALMFIGRESERRWLDTLADRLAQEAASVGIDLESFGLGATDLVRCSPLHPVTVLLLGPLFRNLAQNERSLFSFLASSEPYGFRAFCRETSVGEGQVVTVYGPDRLYDYVSTSMGTALFEGYGGKRWILVQSALDRMRDASSLDIRIVKTVGIVSAVGDAGGLRASLETLAFCLGVSLEETAAALERLMGSSLLVYRGYLGAYHLWDGSDVDIEARLRAAASNIDEHEALSSILSSLLPLQPVVARRHSYRTGTLRFFECSFIDSLDAATAEASVAGADGRVVYAVCGNELALAEALRDAVRSFADRHDIMVVPLLVPATMQTLAVELRRLNWVLNHTPELASDDVALKEVRTRISDVECLLQGEIRSALWPADGHVKCAHAGQLFDLVDERGLNSRISDACDLMFNQAPTINNELLNRRMLSSAASAARRNLVERMIEGSSIENLGIEKSPPELSMYLSLLKATGIHRLDGDVWRFGEPDSASSLAPLWSAWEQFLETCKDARRPLRELWDVLAARPYGVLRGGLPVIVVAMLLTRIAEVGLYEQGTFVPALSLPHAERLSKSPDAFEIRYCPLDSVRRDVLDRLMTTGLPTERGLLVPIVRQLCGLAAKLPEYSRQTKRVSPEAQAVRAALMYAREPDALVFEQLPIALGLSPIENGSATDAVGAYVQQLTDKLAELQAAHALLHDQMLRYIASSMDIQSVDQAGIRSELAARCRTIADIPVDLRIKAFVRQCIDENQTFRTWIESVGSLVVGKPPSAWRDEDLERFETELGHITRRVKRLMQIAFEMGRTARETAASALRLGITNAHGDEQHQVVFATAAPRVAEVADEVAATIARQGISADERIAVLAVLASRWLPGTETHQ